MFNRGPGGGGDGGFFANFFGGPMVNPNQRFDHQYSCYPVSFLGREDAESGNKIMLPPSALDSLARSNIQYPMLFEISNGSSQRTHCGVLEFVAEEGTCYIPYWMMQNLLLSEGDLVRIMNTSLPKGSYVKLRPVSSDFLNIHNPRAVLESCLRNFATLTVGDCVAIMYNNKRYEIEVMECKPANAICIIETDVNVDFAPPRDFNEQQQQGGAPLGIPGGGHGAMSSASSASSSVNDPLNFGNRGADGLVDLTRDGAASSNPPGSPDKFDAESIHSSASSRIFGGAGLRLDGKAPKLASEVGTPRNGGANGNGSDTDEEPWKSKRIPGGVRRQPPYGYNTGNMSAKEAYALPSATGKLMVVLVSFFFFGLYPGSWSFLTRGKKQLQHGLG
ncbi:unnamed protein product [Amoebophrya sp. A25]|nr:unnamed protein product [Amoebophrya sp. A25]|eukprot:GSA25T00017812001.1